jgi:hypothetical protein
LDKYEFSNALKALKIDLTEDRSDESLNKILKIIEDGHPTVGLYVNDKLVSWAVTYPDGASGMLYTLENYRRLGYANIVMQQLFYYRSISNTNYRCWSFV